MASETSHETAIKMDSQSNRSESEISSVYDSLLLIKYRANSDDSSHSSSPVSMTDEIGEEFQFDTNDVESKVFRPIEPAPITPTYNEMEKVSAICEVISEPNTFLTNKSTTIQPSRNDANKINSNSKAKKPKKVKKLQISSEYEKNDENVSKLEKSSSQKFHSGKQNSNPRQIQTETKRYPDESSSDESQANRHHSTNLSFILPIFEKYIKKDSKPSLDIEYVFHK